MAFRRNVSCSIKCNVWWSPFGVLKRVGMGNGREATSQDLLVGKVFGSKVNDQESRGEVGDEDGGGRPEL